MPLIHQYADQLWPPATTIFGVRLRPYSVGHHIALTAMRSPFANGIARAAPDLVTPEELAAAVLVCSCSWHQLDALIKSDGLVERAAGLLARVCSEDEKVDFVEKTKLLADHIERCTREPVYAVVREDASDGNPQAPIELVLKITLQRELGYSEDEAMDKPWGAAMWEYFALREIQGAVELRDVEHERKLIERATSAEHKPN